MLYESISAPRIKSHPDAIEKGVNLNLTCTIVKGTEGRFWWEKDSEKIVNNSRHSVLESGTVLTVTEITSSDCGSYKCVVNNDISREEVHFNMSVKSTGTGNTSHQKNVEGNQDTEELQPL
uniref:neural/ectodermal development factor IMP-L2-like isoform X3 n=1 Tax=Pristiophorus japonicus TaxID=55135 RepID=UPI00398ED96C